MRKPNGSFGFVDIDALLDAAFDELGNDEKMASNVLSDVALLISEKRISEGMSQKDFAEKLGISQGLLSRYENGSENLSVKKLSEIFCKLDIEPKLWFKGKACASETEDHSRISARYVEHMVRRAAQWGCDHTTAFDICEKAS